MTDGTLRVVARIRAKPEAVDRVKAVLWGLVEPTRREPGCIIYDLLQNRDDPADFTFVEEWTGEEALAEHFATEHIQRARKLLPELQDGETVIEKYSAVGE